MDKETIMGRALGSAAATMVLVELQLSTFMKTYEYKGDPKVVRLLKDVLRELHTAMSRIDDSLDTVLETKPFARSSASRRARKKVGNPTKKRRRSK